MSDTVTVAIISASGSVVVAVTALLLNFKLFTSLERRIEVVERDLKDIVASMNEIDKRMTRVEIKLGIQS